MVSMPVSCSGTSGLGNKYPCQGFLWFSSVTPARTWVSTIEKVTTVPMHCLNSSFRARVPVGVQKQPPPPALGEIQN